MINIFNIKKFNSFLFYVWGLSISILPSGYLLGINIKLALLVLLSLFSIFYIKLNKFNINDYIIITLIIIFTALNLINGLNEEYCLSQSKDILAAVSMPIIVYILVKNNIINYKIFLDYSTNWIFFGALFKILLVIYTYVFSLSFITIIEEIGNFFQIQLVTYEFEGVGGRIQLVIDFLLPGAIYYKIVTSTKSIKNYIVIFVLLISCFLTFSRYIWISTIIAIFLSIKYNNIKYFFYLIFFTSFFIIFNSELVSYIYNVVQLRFSENLINVSDNERYIQFEYLLSWIYDAPIIGHGFGSYPKSLIRDELLPYSYELQIMALFGQTGIIGVLCIIIIFLYYYRNILQLFEYNKSKASSILILLIMLVSAGFFNPILFSSAASIFYVYYRSLIEIFTEY